jgi:hypothetical protein
MSVRCEPMQDFTKTFWSIPAEALWWPPSLWRSFMMQTNWIKAQPPLPGITYTYLDPRSELKENAHCWMDLRWTERPQFEAPFACLRKTTWSSIYGSMEISASSLFLGWYGSHLRLPTQRKVVLITIWFPCSFRCSEYKWEVEGWERFCITAGALLKVGVWGRNRPSSESSQEDSTGVEWLIIEHFSAGQGMSSGNSAYNWNKKCRPYKNLL